MRPDSIVFVGLVLLATACTPPPPRRACVPGSSQPCSAIGCIGTQTCSASGDGFGTCMCSGAGAGQAGVGGGSSSVGGGSAAGGSAAGGSAAGGSAAGGSAAGGSAAGGSAAGGSAAGGSAGGGAACSVSCNGCCSGTQCVAAPNNANNTTCGIGGALCANCAAIGALCDGTLFICTAPMAGGSAAGGSAAGGSAAGGSAAGGSAAGGSAAGGSAAGGSAAGGSAAGGSAAGGSAAGGSAAGGSAAGGSAVGGGAGGGSGTCDGCVLANGTCQPRGTTRQNNNVCGSGGQLCQSCLSPTPACDNGVCVAPPLRVGDACVLDAQCQSSIGPTARCKQQNLNGAIIYSGGHCTVFDCAATGLDMCPLGSVCLILPRIYSEEQSQCFASGCGAAAPCRPGYSCFNLGTNVTGCLPTAINDLNLVLDTTSVVGGACTLNSQCRAPVPGAPFAGGACITEFVSRADGGLVLGSDGGPQPTGNPGGYCTRLCRIDEDCTSTGGEDLAEGLCLGVSQTSALCFRGCASPRGGQSNCRPSYVCERLLTSDGGVLPTGYCEGRCDVPGGACGNYADGGARPCLSTGYCLF